MDLETKMNDNEILELYENVKNMFGDNLPNFEHYPRQFGYYVTLYHYRQQKTVDNSSEV